MTALTDRDDRRRLTGAIALLLIAAGLALAIAAILSQLVFPSSSWPADAWLRTAPAAAIHAAGATVDDAAPPQGPAQQTQKQVRP